MDAECGVTDANETNAYIKQTLLSQAKRKVLALDHTKFDKKALVRICKLSELTHVVTDTKPSAEWLETLADNHIACVYPKNII